MRPGDAGTQVVTVSDAATVELVKTTLLYDVPSPTEENTHYETTPPCSHPDYVADRETRTIRPAQKPGEMPVDSLLRDNHAIVNFEEASPLPWTDLGGGRAMFAVAELGAGVEPAAAYVLDEPIPVPELSARLSGGEAVVRVDDREVTVGRVSTAPRFRHRRSGSGRRLCSTEPSTRRTFRNTSVPAGRENEPETDPSAPSYTFTTVADSPSRESETAHRRVRRRRSITAAAPRRRREVSAAGRHPCHRRRHAAAGFLTEIAVRGLEMSEYPEPSTAETLVYVLVAYYLVAAVANTLGWSLSPLVTLGLSMATVFAAIAGRLPSRWAAVEREILGAIRE